MSNIDFESLSNEELLAYIKERTPTYRKVISKVTSFCKALTRRGSKLVSLSASDVTLDVSGTGNTGKSGGRVVKVETFRAPNFARLRSSIEVLENTQELDELSQIISIMESRNAKALKSDLKAFSKLYDSMLDAYNTAFSVLEDMAEKVMPTEISNVVIESQKAIQERLKSYKSDNDNPDTSILIGTKGDIIAFSYYTHLDESVGQKLVLVVTCQLKPVRNEYLLTKHVTTLTRILPPFQYSVGPVTNNVRAALLEEMDMHNVLAELSKVELKKVDATTIKAAMETLGYVNDVDVTSDSIVVKVSKAKQDQFKELFARIGANKDVKRLVGTKNRLNGELNKKHEWVFTIVGR